MKTLACFGRALVAALFVAGCGYGAAADVPAVAIRDGGAAVDVTGLSADALRALLQTDRKPDEWTALFAVYVDPTDGSDPSRRPAVLGDYRVVDNALRFTPRFPLAPASTTGRCCTPTGCPARNKVKKRLLSRFIWKKRGRPRRRPWNRSTPPRTSCPKTS